MHTHMKTARIYKQNVINKYNTTFHKYSYVKLQKTWTSHTIKNCSN